MGMYLMRQIGDRGVYGNPELPDFMVFLNWDHLPWYWEGINHFWFSAPLILLVPGILAFVFGYFAFRARVGGVYLSIITQSLTFALALAFYRNEMGFGGNNGLTDFKDILGAPLASDTTRIVLLVATVLILTLCYVLCRVIVNSRLGRVTTAIRDAEMRTRFLGYHVEWFKLAIFTICSIELVIWVAVGGRASLYGAIIGAILVNYAKTVFTGVFPEGWLYALGLIFVLVTLFLPKGVMGIFEQIKAKILARRLAESKEA